MKKSIFIQINKRKIIREKKYNSLVKRKLGPIAYKVNYYYFKKISYLRYLSWILNYKKQRKSLKKIYYKKWWDNWYMKKIYHIPFFNLYYFKCKKNINYKKKYYNNIRNINNIIKKNKIKKKLFFKPFAFINYYKHLNSFYLKLKIWKRFENKHYKLRIKKRWYTKKKIKKKFKLKLKKQFKVNINKILLIKKRNLLLINYVKLKNINFINYNIIKKNLIFKLTKNNLLYLKRNYYLTCFLKKYNKIIIKKESILIQNNIYMKYSLYYFWILYLNIYFIILLKNNNISMFEIYNNYIKFDNYFFNNIKTKYNLLNINYIFNSLFYKNKYMFDFHIISIINFYLKRNKQSNTTKNFLNYNKKKILEYIYSWKGQKLKRKYSWNKRKRRKRYISKLLTYKWRKHLFLFKLKNLKKNKKKKNLYIINIIMTFNNIHLILMTLNGDVLYQVCAGMLGIIGSQRTSLVAAEALGYQMCKILFLKDIKNIIIRFNGILRSKRLKAIIKGIFTYKVSSLYKLVNITPKAHNGLREKKKRNL